MRLFLNSLKRFINEDQARQFRCLGVHRLFRIFFNTHGTSHEVAGHFLFFFGLLIEIVLLILVVIQEIVLKDQLSTYITTVSIILTVLLFLALGTHQLFIFKNSRNQDASGNGLRWIEILMGLVFGILSGEVGYFYVLIKCNSHFLDWSDAYIFSSVSGDRDTIVTKDLDTALKGIFAGGAAILFLLVILWDVCVCMNKELLKIYATHIRYFLGMDILAFLIWCGVLGTILPFNLLELSHQEWAFNLLVLSVTYIVVALIRVFKAVDNLTRPSTYQDAIKQVI